MIEKVNLGMIGCGAHTLETLIPVITKTKGSDVIAVSDVVTANAKKAMQMAGAKSWYTDYNKMLLTEGLDAVIVAVPSHLLSRVTIDSAKAGVHVFVEKPMATSMAEAHEMIKATKKANTRLMVGFCQRYARVRKEMKQLLERGVVGEPEVVTAGKGNVAPHEWRMDPKKGGGILLWLGCHVIDQILWLVESDVKRVFGEVNRSRGYNIDETAVFSIRFQNNVIANVNSTMRTPVLFDFIEVRGSDGFIRSDWSTRDVNILQVFSKNIEEYASPTLIEVKENKELGWRTMYQRELQEFREAILEERDPAISGSDGERVLHVVEAVFKSGETGEPVTFLKRKMCTRDVEFIVTPEVKKLGIDVCMAVFNGANIANKSLSLERHKKEDIKRLEGVDIRNNKILEGYRELYQRIGIKGHIPPAEHLIRLIQKNGRLPNVNTVVDSYNVVSIETFLSIGAHDLAHIKGNVVFGITDGTERYTPLGRTKPEAVKKGEYACMDSEKILCRMDIKQCEETKITKKTKSFMVYVQGNRYVSSEYLQKALGKVCENMVRCCGASYREIKETNI